MYLGELSALLSRLCRAPPWPMAPGLSMAKRPVGALTGAGGCHLLLRWAGGADWGSAACWCSCLSLLPPGASGLLDGNGDACCKPQILPACSYQQMQHSGYQEGSKYPALTHANEGNAYCLATQALQALWKRTVQHSSLVQLEVHHESWYRPPSACRCPQSRKPCTFTNFDVISARTLS